MACVQVSGLTNDDEPLNPICSLIPELIAQTASFYDPSEIIMHTHTHIHKSDGRFIRGKGAKEHIKWKLREVATLASRPPVHSCA